MHAGRMEGVKRGKGNCNLGRTRIRRGQPRARRNVRRVLHGSDGNTYNTHGPRPGGRERGERVWQSGTGRERRLIKCSTYYRTAGRGGGVGGW